MGYVLINGKRYYQDSNGKVTLDNVSQAEADRRERRNQTGNTSNTPVMNSSVPWRIIIVIAVLIMVVGAFIYNRSHVSPAEQAIIDYMEDVSGTTESITEENAEASADNTSE